MTLNTTDNINNTGKTPTPKKTTKLLAVVVRGVILFVVVCLIVLLLFFYYASTDSGTQILLNNISNKTGINIGYSEGNLKDGLSVKDVSLSVNDKKLDIEVDEADIKIGWRAIFTQVHLSEVNINHLIITNHQEPSGDGFSYKRISTPVDLLIENAQVNKVSYFQPQASNFILKDITAEKASWLGTKISVHQGAVQYEDMAIIKKINGHIDLSDNYPIRANASAELPILQKAHINQISAEVLGSLQKLNIDANAKYNGQPIQADIVTKPLLSGLPFWSKITWDDINLPYAEKQNIELQKGIMVANGIKSDIDLRINSELTAKDIPSGLYHVTANVKPTQDEMTIDKFSVESELGNLLGAATLNWKDSFVTHTDIKANNYDIASGLSETYVDYKDYLPKSLDGNIIIDYIHENDAGNLQTNIHLMQNTSEDINLQVEGIRQKNNQHQEKTPVNRYLIDATWQNLKRQNIPNIGELISDDGRVSINYDDEKISTKLDTKINKLNNAPVGRYTGNINKTKNIIDLDNVSYNGEIGQLLTSGTIKLRTKYTPTSWALIASSDGLNMHDWMHQAPLNDLKGSTQIKGKLLEDNNTQIYKVAIFNTNIQSGFVDSYPIKHAQFKGTAQGDFTFVNSIFESFTTDIDGNVGVDDIPNAKLVANMLGNSQHIKLDKLSYDGEAADLNAVADIKWDHNNTHWDVTADLNKVNTQYFFAAYPANLQGQLITKGRWYQPSRQNSAKPKIQLDDFVLKFDGDVATEKLPDGNLIIDVTGNNNIFEVHQLKHHGEAGNINASGKININKEIGWDIDANMQSFNLGYFVKSLPSNLTGVINSNGQWANNRQIININNMHLQGSLKQKPVQASGKLQAKLHLPNKLKNLMNTLSNKSIDNQYHKVSQLIEEIDAKELITKWGDNYITLNGNQKDLTASVNITNLVQLSNKLSGELNGSVILKQADSNAVPVLYVDMKAEEVAIPHLLLKTGKIQGKIVDFGKQPSQLEISMQNFETDDLQFNALKTSFNGTKSNHNLQLKLSNAQADFQSNLKGRWDSQSLKWTGSMGQGKLAANRISLSQVQPTQLVLDYANKSLQAAAHCWKTQTGTGKLCFNKNLSISKNNGQLIVDIQQLDTHLISFLLPKDISWQAKVNAQADVMWQQGRPPKINIKAYSDNGKLGMTQEDSAPITIPYNRLSIIAVTKPQGLAIRTDVDNGNHGKGFVDVLIDPSKANKPINGDVQINDINLAVFKSFFPGMRNLKGYVSAAGKVSGTLKHPDFNGQVKIKDGEVSLLYTPVNLSKINAVAKVSGKTAIIDGQFASGNGIGNVTGNVDWKNILQAKLRVTGNKLTILQPPLLAAEITPDVELIVRPKQKYLSIIGAISVPSATIRPPTVNEDIIGTSEDVVVLDRRQVGDIDKVLSLSQPWIIESDIGVDLGENVNFSGFGATLPLAGAVVVSQYGHSKMQSKGMIQVSRRTPVDAFGQVLDLNYAQVRFNGDITKPILSIEAIKKISSNTIGLRVKGDIIKPNISVFNDAGLTKQQAMNALVTGRIESLSSAPQVSEQGFQSKVTTNIAAAGLSLGLSGTRNFTNQVGRAFGLHGLTISAASNDTDTNVNVTGYITPDLYLRYGVGVFNAESSLSARYQLTRRVYVEATSATEKFIDVVYSWQF